jgi:hypothetical protein
MGRWSRSSIVMLWAWVAHDVAEFSELQYRFEQAEVAEQGVGKLESGEGDCSRVGSGGAESESIIP